DQFHQSAVHSPMVFPATLDPAGKTTGPAEAKFATAAQTIPITTKRIEVLTDCSFQEAELKLTHERPRDVPSASSSGRMRGSLTSQANDGNGKTCRKQRPGVPH